MSSSNTGRDKAPNSSATAPSIGARCPSAAAESSQLLLHLAVLDGHKEAFAEQAHAQELVDQWNAAYADTIARDRAEGLQEAADRLTGRIETCERTHWERYGPGGLAAVWTRVPQQRRVYSRSANFAGFASRRKVNEFGPCWSPVWEFRESFTDRPTVTRWNLRARGTVAVDVYGLNQEAVDAAFADAVMHVESNPNTDDHLDAEKILLVLRGIGDGFPARYCASEVYFHTDVRAAARCGLVHEEGTRLSLTEAGIGLYERISSELPDPRAVAWETLPNVPDLAAEVTARYPAGPAGGA